MNSKASRILGIEEDEESPSTPKASSGWRTASFRSSKRKTRPPSKGHQTPLPQRTSFKSGMKVPARSDDLDLALDSDSDFDYDLRDGSTPALEVQYSSPVDETPEQHFDALEVLLTAERARKHSASSAMSQRLSRRRSAISDRALQILGIQREDGTSSRRGSAASGIAPLEQETLDITSPILPAIKSASPHTTSFTNNVLKNIPGSYPDTPLPAPATTATPGEPTRQAPKKTPAALLLQRLSMAQQAPTAPAPQSPLPSTPPKTPRTPLTPVKPSKLNTFTTSTHLHTHGPITLKSKRRSASINPLAGWGWDALCSEDCNDEDAHTVFAEDLLVSETVVYFQRRFAGMAGEDPEADADVKGTVVDEVWSKEWLAAPVLDVGLIEECAERVVEVENALVGGGMGGSGGRGRGRGWTGSGVGRKHGRVGSSFTKSPWIARPGSGMKTGQSASGRFSGVSGGLRCSTASSVSVRASDTSNGGVGVRGSIASVRSSREAAMSPARKSTSAQGKKPEGLKEMWFRRGLF